MTKWWEYELFPFLIGLSLFNYSEYSLIILKIFSLSHVWWLLFFLPICFIIQWDTTTKFCEFWHTAEFVANVGSPFFLNYSDYCWIIDKFVSLSHFWWLLFFLPICFIIILLILITAILVLSVGSLKLQPYAFRWNSNRNHVSKVSLIFIIGILLSPTRGKGKYR